MEIERLGDAYRFQAQPEGFRKPYASDSENNHSTRNERIERRETSEVSPKPGWVLTLPADSVARAFLRNMITPLQFEKVTLISPDQTASGSPIGRSCKKRICYTSQISDIICRATRSFYFYSIGGNR